VNSELDAAASTELKSVPLERLEQLGEGNAVGRKRRTVPPAVRRALGSRDHGCRFPGSPIPAVPRNRPGSGRRLLHENRAAGLEITQETPVARSACEHLDYDIAIEGMLAAEGLLRVGWVTPWHQRDPNGDPEGSEPGPAEPKLSQPQLLT
jgi:hypothetical protein